MDLLGYFKFQIVGINPIFSLTIDQWKVVIGQKKRGRLEKVRDQEKLLSD